MLTLTEVGWGADNPAYRQLFTNHYIPEATPKQMGWFNEMQRLSASPENAVRLQRVLASIDVRPLLPQVRTPTLVFHSRDDQAVPFAQGEELAAGIPGAGIHPAREPATISCSRLSRPGRCSPRSAANSSTANLPPAAADATPRKPESADVIRYTSASDGTKLGLSRRPATAFRWSRRRAG